MRTATMAAVALSTIVSTAACAPGTGSRATIEPGQPFMSSQVSVSVENQRPTAMRIFATRSNMRFLVGEVGPRQTARFALPTMVLSGQGEFRLVADPWGSTLHQESEPIVLTGGREVQWRLRAGGSDRVWVR